MLIPGRHEASGSYRYGFQGQEKDDEIKGEGNSLNYTFRMHDPRVGRFFAVDPLATKYPWNSPYAFAENKVVLYTELEGLQTPDVATNTAEVITKAAPELSKSYVDETGKLILDYSDEALKTTSKSTNLIGIAGKALGFISMFLIDNSPNFGGETSESVIFGRVPNYQLKPTDFQVDTKVDLKPKLESITKPINEIKPITEDDIDDTILLYRGVSSFNEKQYNFAKLGIAIPKPELDLSFNGTPHSDMGLHAAGDNYSIWTSWTIFEETARIFSNGPFGLDEGVILSKRFKKSEVQFNFSDEAKLMNEGEYLVPGIVTGAEVENTKPKL